MALFSSIFLLIFPQSEQLFWHIKFEKLKALKKELKGKLMPVVQHPNRWWDWCVSEDEKKRNKSDVY